jgi:vacuolar-type H+-ATPase subunit H
MTTDHVTDESVHATGVAAERTDADSATQAEDDSRQLLAKARYDAFRLMTDARDEAQTILDEATSEAAGTRKAAEVVAASVTEKANADAAAIIESAQREAATIGASAHRTESAQEADEVDDALEAEHQALSERVSTLRTLAEQLEDRFAALAATAGAPSPTTAETAQNDAVAEEAVVEGDDPPSTALHENTPEGSGQDASEVRGSFYNRRSANLPSLGEDGGRSAFNMTRSMREAMETD